jgi:hypothetical protein
MTRQNVVTFRRVRRCFIIESVAVAAFVRPFCRSILWAVVRRVQSPVQRRIVRRTINVFAARACISAFATFTVATFTVATFNVATFNVATLFVTGRFSVCAEPIHDGEVLRGKMMLLPRLAILACRALDDDDG